MIIIRRGIIPPPAAGDTLVAFWPMNEGSGTTLNDTIGGRNLTLGGTAGWSGGLVNFVNPGDAATGSNISPLNFGSTLTVFGWVKGPPQTTNGTTFLGAYDFGNSNRCFALSSSATGSFNTIRALISADGTALLSSTGTAVVLDTTGWHSVCFRFNSGTIDLFADGVKETPTPTGSASTVFAGNTPIGVNAVFNNGVASGTLEVGALQQSKFSIYSNAVSDANILALHNAGH